MSRYVHVAVGALRDLDEILGGLQHLGHPATRRSTPVMLEGSIECAGEPVDIRLPAGTLDSVEDFGFVRRGEGVVLVCGELDRELLEGALLEPLVKHITEQRVRLAAAEAGLRTVTLEQGSVAESIQSFPRGKLVFDQPLGLPLEGDLWLSESTKEELLGQWRRIIRARRLPIEEGTRVTAVVRRPGPTPQFEVQAHTAAGPRTWITRRVILALGRRGTPRKLPVAVPEALQSRVHYSLADARSLAGRRVLIVGLGDVAMEAAIALARQPDTTVTVSYRGDDFRRGKGRNIEQVKRLTAAGRIDLRLRTEVERIEPGEIILRSPDGPQPIPWDTLLVMIGSLAPWDFLEQAGVRRVKVDAAPVEATAAPLAAGG